MSDMDMGWALSGACSSGLALTALAVLLLVPAQYYVPALAPPLAPPDAGPVALPEPKLTWLDRALEFPPLNLFVTIMLLCIGVFTYLCEWIQRKIMEKRIVKLNQYLCSSVERLRAWDAQQEQLETTLKLVQNATSEYNLLLYLLLRQHRCAPHPGPPSNCFFDKGLDAPLISSPRDL